MMEAIGLYLVKSAVWITGFGLVFMLFLRNERFFILNRIYLVAGIVISLFLPLIPVKYYVDIPAMQSGVHAGAAIAAVMDAGSGQSFVALLLFGFWLSGVLFILTRYVIQVVPVLKAAKDARPVPDFPAQLIRSSEFPNSFSLFSLVIVNPSVSETEAREIMNHEMVHIRQMHWLDLMLSGILCAVQWFNPAVWIYSRFVRQNHEYLADAEALQRTSDPAVYRATLLNQIAGSPVIDLGNFFSYSLNKKRFNMMKNIISSPFRKLRLLIILPVAAIVLYAFAEPQYRVTAPGADPTAEGYIQADLTKSVKGAVRSEEGNPLEGAVVIVKGTTVGTTTDGEGRFALKDVPDDATLFITYVGYETASVSASVKGEITVRMKKSNIMMETVQVTPGAPPPPPPPPPPPTAASIPVNALIIVDGVVYDKKVDDISPNDIESINVLKGEAALAKYGNKGKNGVILITTKEKAASKTVKGVDIGVTGEKLPEKEVFVVVEEMPQFPGGDNAMQSWIGSNLTYPAAAFRDKISGKVIASFVISSTGKVGDVKIVRSAHPLLDAEALRVITIMPDWKPGKQKGKAVDVKYTMPVEFSLR